MLKDRGKRLAGIRTRILITAAMALIVPVTALASASPAMAEPKGIFKIFKQCPTEIPGIELCNFAQTTSGEFKLGTTTVPINKTITLQGGDLPTGNPENPAEYFALPAKNGESLSKTELNVPGGITGLIKCEEIKGEGLAEKFLRGLCKETLEKGITAVSATTELVASRTNPAIFNEFALAEREGTALTLPLRVHLKNPLLGNSCYIGSESHPLQVHLTTGETHPPAGFTPLHGALGTPETLEEKELRMLRITGNSLVDNTFSAPGSEGCGEFFIFKGFLDGLINAKIKVPNKAGENAAVLNGELNAATAEAVVASEKF
ncbi:MAG: hypothetical protein ACHP7P_14450 [Terriglobales bacterium]